MQEAIDFIAYHGLQAQAGQSVFDALRGNFKCNWLIGPNRKPSGAKAAVLLDHICFQPLVKKSRLAYRYLFHLSHDMGDVDIYDAERERLLDFDIIFAPSSAHCARARAAFGPRRLVFETGWPKYDLMHFAERQMDVADKIRELPKRSATVLYAPTWANTWEWKELLPLLLDLEVNVIVKNHIYVDPGQPFPPGQEQAYREALNSAGEMESSLSQRGDSGFIVVPREMNICSLFPFVDVLISDQSSACLEFLPFGTSIETGRFGVCREDTAPAASLITDEVLYMPLDVLTNCLSSKKDFDAFVHVARKQGMSGSFIGIGGPPAGVRIAQMIQTYLSLHRWTFANVGSVARRLIEKDYVARTMRELDKSYQT